MRPFLPQVLKHWPLLLAAAALTCAFASMQVKQEVLIGDVSLIKTELKQTTSAVAKMSGQLDLLVKRQLGVSPSYPELP